MKEIITLIIIIVFVLAVVLGGTAVYIDNNVAPAFISK